MAPVTPVRSASAVFSYLEGFRWKLHARVGFDTAPGTQVRVRLTVARNPDAKDARDELKLSHVLEGTVLLPEPTEVPVADGGPPADAGAVVPKADPERAILRVALFEIVHRPDVPDEVAIDEAVETAKLYCGVQAPGFVNGILGGILKKVNHA